jgi:hypothetical protein
MNDLFTSDSDTNGSEPLDEGGTWLLDLVSAVDHLRRGYRPGFTVWDALAEAIDWANVVEVAGPSSAAAGPSLNEGMHRAVRNWVRVMAGRYNAGHHWPHPQSRRTFPPALMVDHKNGYLEA